MKPTGEKKKNWGKKLSSLNKSGFGWIHFHCGEAESSVGAECRVARAITWGGCPFHRQTCKTRRPGTRPCSRWPPCRLHRLSPPPPSTTRPWARAWLACPVSLPRPSGLLTPEPPPWVCFLPHSWASLSGTFLLGGEDVVNRCLELGFFFDFFHGAFFTSTETIRLFGRGEDGVACSLKRNCLTLVAVEIRAPSRFGRLSLQIGSHHSRLISTVVWHSQINCNCSLFMRRLLLYLLPLLMCCFPSDQPQFQGCLIKHSIWVREAITEVIIAKVVTTVDYLAAQLKQRSLWNCEIHFAIKHLKQ